jgi:hypothetical protein
MNPVKLRAMFDKMTEIDTNPHSKSSQEFEKSLNEEAGK